MNTKTTPKPEEKPPRVISFEDFQKLDPKEYTFIRVIPPTQQDRIRAKTIAAKRNK